MKYWLATTEFPPTGGGIAPYCLQTAQMLDAAGHEVRVLHLDHTVDATQITSLSERTLLVRFNQRDLASHHWLVSPLGGHAHNSFCMAQIIEQAIDLWGRPDIVEFQDYGALGYYTLQNRWSRISALDDTRIILTAHRPLKHTRATNEESAHRLPHWFTGEMERWCYAAADAVFYPSAFIEQRLQEPDMGFAHHAGFTVRNPYTPTIGALEKRLDALETPSADKDQSVPSTPDANDLFEAHLDTLQTWPTGWSKPTQNHNPPLVFLGKLQVQKGILDLLDLMDIWWDKGGANPLHVHGRDEWVDARQISMRALIEQRYAHRIAQGLLRLNDGYNRGDIPTILAESACVVMPNREECMPYAVLESISAGAIPLCAPGGGLQELIAPDVQGELVYDPDNRQDYIDKLNALLLKEADERARISARLKAHIEALAAPEKVLAVKLDSIANTPSPNTRSSFPFAQSVARTEIPRPPRLETPGMVSVVIPYFNMQDYVAEAVDSVLAAGWQKLEIIVVNDGSTVPEAASALDKLKADIPPETTLRVVDKANGGLSSARNTGADAAQGEYLLFLDADDRIAPDFYHPLHGCAQRL